MLTVACGDRPEINVVRGANGLNAPKAGAIIVPPIHEGNIKNGTNYSSELAMQ